MIPLTLTFDFDLILGSFFTFWVCNMGYFRGGVQGSKTALESAHIVEQLSFFMIPSILTYRFYFLAIWSANGLFLGSGQGSKSIQDCTHVVKQLLFSTVPSILIFDFDWILGSVLTFWGPNVLFLGLGKGSETVLGSPHID